MLVGTEDDLQVKAILYGLAWRFKIGWKCVGGHYVDASGAYAKCSGSSKPVAYRFIWCHNRTHNIRTEDKPL